MIKGIENFEPRLQKAILQCISSLFDISSDIEIEEIDDNIICINDITYYVTTDAEQACLLTKYNTQAFDDYFSNLSTEQLKYVDEDTWEEKNGLHTFEEWINKYTDYIVEDSDYYGQYNFYEIR